MVSTIVGGHYVGLSMAKRRQRRYWSDDEKSRIVAQTKVPGSSVSQVARRYDVNANLVFKWLRDRRYQPTADAVGPFLPVDVLVEPSPAIALPAGSDDGTIEVTLTNGVRLRISGAFDADRACRLIRGLSR